MLEKRLFEAFQNHRGIRLSAEDVQDLINLDNSLKARISNAASDDRAGSDCVSHSSAKTWAEFKQELAHIEPEEE